MKQTHRSLFVVVLAVLLSGCVSVALVNDHVVSNKNVVFKTNSDQLSTSWLWLISPSSQILEKVADILKHNP